MKCYFSRSYAVIRNVWRVTQILDLRFRDWEKSIFITFADPLIGQQYCIISDQEGVYGVYVVLKFLVRHLMRLVLVLLCMIRPRTRIAKRVSLILVGEPAACKCVPSGEEVNRPHECPKMKYGRCTPDLIKGTNGKSSIPALLEDPVRRKFKIYLAVALIIRTIENENLCFWNIYLACTKMLVW